MVALVVLVCSLIQRLIQLLKQQLAMATTEISILKLNKDYQKLELMLTEEMKLERQKEIHVH